MRFDGEWLECDDGVFRPVIRGECRAADGAWLAVEFLIDTGADVTVLSANVARTTKLPASETSDQLAGFGGSAQSLIIDTAVRIRRDDGTKVVFQGQIAATLEPTALDMSILGRDVLDLFAVIVDRPGGAVCLIRQPHRYRIETQ